MKRSKESKVVLTFIVASILLCACSGGGQEVSYESGGMTHKFTDGKDATKAPFLLPIYPNAKATGEVQSEGNGDDNSFMMLSSTDPVSKVAEYYKSELQKQGWTVNQQQMLPNLVNMSAKKEKLDGSIMLSGDDSNKTTINLSVSVAQEGTPEVSKDDFSPDKLNPPTD